jgi:hypothetical protein
MKNSILSNFYYKNLPKFQGDKKGSQVGGFVVPPMPPTMPAPIQLIGNLINAFSEKKQKPSATGNSSLNVDKKIRIKLKDPRKIRMTTGSKINPNRDLMSGEYSLDDMNEAIKRAKKRGLSVDDAWNMAAIDFQETLLGNRDDEMGHAKDYQGEDNIDRFLNAYQDKMKTANRLKYKDPYLRLQVYNGLGKVYPETEQWYHGFKANSFYGVPVPKTGLDLKRNPLYGKQIVDLRDNVLKKNPEFIKFINNAYGEGMKRNGGMITDPKGQWAHPGENTRIPGGNITMEGVPYPVLAKASNGMTTMMQPGQDYFFPGADYVDEYPMMRNGGWLEKYQSKGQVTRPPIYTDDPNDPRLIAFGDTTRANESTQLLLNALKEYNKNPTEKNRKAYYKAQDENYAAVSGYTASSNRDDRANSKINKVKYIGPSSAPFTPQNAPDGNPDYYFTYPKAVQPYILQKEPRLKGSPQRVSPLPMGGRSDQPSLQFRQMPQIEERPIRMGEYKVSYYDPEIKDWNERSFMTEDESGKFMNEMSQRGFGSGYGNVTQRRVINKKAYGGSMMQDGGPTAQDSIIVRNSAIANKIYYDNLRKKGMYGAPKIENWKYGNPRNNPEFLREKQSWYLKDWMENVKQRGIESQRNILTGSGSMMDKMVSASAEAAWLQNNPGKTRNDYIKLVSKTLGRIKASGLSQFDPNKYYYKDLAPEVIDPSVPFVTIDTRIQPQYQTTYIASSGKNPSSGAWVELLEYDPLAVTPYNMRTPQEKIEWEKKYGSKKITKSTPVEKKQSKPKIEPKPEPTLKPRPFVPATKIPMGQPATGMGIRERQMPNISASNVEMSGPYMVGYTDYDTQQGIDKGFRSAEERDAFVEQLRQRPAGNYQPSQMNISSYYDVNKRKKKAYGGPTFYNQEGFATTLQTTTDPSVEKARDCGKDCNNKTKGIIDYSTKAERGQERAWDKEQAAADEKAAKERKIASDNYINMKYGFDGYPLDGSDYDNRQQQYNEFLKVNPTFGKDPSYTGKLKPKERYALLDNMLLQVKRAPGISYSTRLSKKFNIADPKKLTVADMMNYANQMGGYDKFREWVDAGGPEIQRHGGDISIPDLPQPFSKIRIKAYGGPMVNYMKGRMTGPNIF